MSGTGSLKWMRCYVCGERIMATIVQAKDHGWTVWVGGAVCKTCPAPVESPAPRPAQISPS